MKKYWLLSILIFIHFVEISAQNKPTITIETPQNTPIGLLSISPDGEYLAASTLVKYNNKYWVWIWELKTNTLLYSFDGHEQQVQKLVFCPYSKYLVSVGGYEGGKNVFCFELDDDKVELKNNISKHKIDGVTSVVFPLHNGFCVVGLDGNVVQYRVDRELQSEYKSKITPLTNNAYYDVAVDNEKKLISFAGRQNKTSGILLLCKQTTWSNFTLKYREEIIFRKKIDNDYFTNTFFNSNSNYLLGVTNQKKLHVFDIKNNYEETIYENIGIQKLKPHITNPDILYVLNQNNNIVSYNLKTMQLQKTILKGENKITDFTFSIDGLTLITGNEKGKIEFYESNIIQEELNQFVNDEMKKWLQKGKFEKTDAYITRTTPENQNQQAQIFSQDYFKNKFKYIKIPKWEYDADNETFKLDIDFLGNIIFKVPLDKAKDFDESLTKQQVLISEVEFCFLNNQVSIKKAKIRTMLAPRQYYDYVSGNNVFQNTIAYKPTIIDIHTPTLPIQNPVTPTIKVTENELSTNIPKNNKKNPNGVAVIIGNSKYQKTQAVDFAVNDAQLMKKYVIEVLGFSEGNIIYVENASYIDFKLIFGAKDNPKGKLFNTIKPNISDVFIYYSGHGAPDLNNKKAYFVPVEADPQYIELTCFEMEVFYDNLAQIPAKSVNVILDACFSGTNIYKNISPIVIKSKGALGLKNGALLASCAADQVSSWYNEKGQSLFTYFFLKAIHNKNADKNKDNKLTMQEIYDYVSDNAEGVPYYARRLHAIQQNPVLNGQNLNKILIEW